MYKDRLEVWKTAKDEVQDIVSEHGLEIMTQPGSSNMLLQMPAKTYSKVDQHIDAIIKVADWLLEKDED